MVLTDQELAQLKHEELPDVRNIVKENKGRFMSLPNPNTLARMDNATHLPASPPSSGDSHAQKLKQLQEFSRIFRLAFIDAAMDHKGDPLYLEVQIRPFDVSNASKAIEKLFNDAIGLKMNDETSHLIKQVTNTPFLDLSRVFIPTEKVHPYIQFSRTFGIHDDDTRAARWKALLVAFLGDVYPLTCSSCSKTYASTITSAKEHVNHPFFDCCSYQDAFDGACPGCISRGKPDECSYVQMPGYRPLDSTPEAAALAFSGEANSVSGASMFDEEHPFANSKEICYQSDGLL